MLYRQNPIIIIPPITLAIIFFLIATVMPALVSLPRSFFFSMLPLLVTLVGLVALFFVVLGSAGMTGRVILEGQTNLRDWRVSIRKHFRVVLGLGLVFALVFYLSSGAAGILTINLMSLLRLSPGNLFLIIRWIINSPVESLVLSLFYIILASAIIDGRGIMGSLRHGLRAVRNAPGTYSAYLGILILISTATIVIQIPLEGSMGTIVLATGRAVASPFLLIMAFLIYRNKRDVVPSQDQLPGEQLRHVSNLCPPSRAPNNTIT